MNTLWTTLTPLIVGSALVPVQLLITLLLLRSDKGRVTAVGYVGGMTTVRLAQGVVFGLVLSSAATTSSGSSDGQPGEGVLILLLVMGLLFLVTGLRHLFEHEDPDAPPPKWLTMLEGIGAPKAFGFGILTLALAPKFWVFTLGAIAAIGAADLGRPEAMLAFLVFVVLAEIGHLLIIGVAYAVPERSAQVLDAIGAWLRSNNRVIMIWVSFIFGVWFLWKSLDGLGVV